MKYNYIYNIIDLYLKNESSVKKIHFNLTKMREKVSMELYMVNDSENKTSFDIPLTEINNYITDILKKYKDDLIVINEDYKLNSRNKLCYYSVQFNNGRTLSLNNFSMIEINNLRNILFDINLLQEEMHLSLDEPKQMNYKPRLQPTGFANFKILSFAVIVFVVTIVLSLWIFNVLIK